MPGSPAFGLRLRASSGKTGVVLSRPENESRNSRAHPLRFRNLLLALLAVLMTAACGPSVQSIYEGNVRFEHCYRLDLEVDSAPTHRQACWKEWLGMYTYGQPRDRIEYARRRVHAFAGGDTARPRLEISGTPKPVEARQFYLVMPAPTSVHAPPPPVATRWYGDAGSPSGPAPAPALAEPPAAPEDECGAACRKSYEQCAAPCEADAGKPDPSCNTCSPDYKNCMKRCFK